jgi:phosphoribosylformylglycinamidine synthase
LNFGNPYNPEVYWQFVNVIEGMGEACRKFDTPVTGGNVSFYNQSSDDGPVFPTPVIGMIGILENHEMAMTLDFRNDGDLIYLIGESSDDIGSSEYLRNICGVKFSPAPYFLLDEEFLIQETVKGLIKENLINSAHDVSDGGLFNTLLESAMPNEVGFDISTDENFRKDSFLFGEAQSRIVVSVSPDKQDKFIDFMIGRTNEFMLLGEVMPSNIVIDNDDWGDVKEWKEVYENAIGKEMEQSVEV